MKHMKKLLGRFLAFALIFCMTFSAVGDGMVAHAATPRGNSAIFSDVYPDAWYAEAVNWCKENGIMDGTSSTTFSPGSVMARAMLAAVLYRAAGSPAVSGTLSYTDAKAGSWYANALVWGAETGFMSGYDNGMFGVSDPMTREQMATVLWRQQGSPAVAAASAFEDEASISSFALQAVYWAKSEGIISGKDGNRFDPKGQAARAEVATVLYRTLKVEEPAPTPDPGVTELKTDTYNLNGVEFKMILVEGGAFTMGSDARAQGGGTQVSNQKGEHQVTLSSYLIGETEVTQALWNEVMNGSHSSSDLNYPVASVTVPDCRAFIEKLNEKAHAAGIIPEGQNFHMLTEAQWEFAAKGGNQSKGYTYAGSNTLSEVGWTSDDGGSVHAVKQKKPNELGLYDMSGNVYEWVADYAAPYSAAPQTDPCYTTPTNDYIKRGGSFYYNDDYRFTTTYRYFYSATDYTIGLRIGLY